MWAQSLDIGPPLVLHPALLLRPKVNPYRGTEGSEPKLKNIAVKQPIYLNIDISNIFEPSAQISLSLGKD